jgi:hypothetical protein
MAIKDYSMKPKAAELADPLEGLDDEQLLALRHRLDKKLNLDLTKLNLADELGSQYRAGTLLLSSVQEDKDVPANQRAQVFNSVSAMLEKIVKQQKIVYSAERLKRFESAFIKVLEELPLDLKRKFFDMYGEFLQEEKPAEEAAE